MGGVVSMKEMITTFLESNNFNRIEDTDINLFTNRLKSEYFIIHENSVEELVNYFNLEKSNAVIERFTTLTTSKRLENIKKNTTMFILVEVDNLKQSFKDERIQKSILLIEEDFYYFRKFVILYTAEGREELKGITNNEALVEVLEKDFLKFENDMFFSESYFIAMELGVKMPFFVLPRRESVYQTIEQQFENIEKEKKDDILINWYSNVLTNDERKNIISDTLTDYENDSDIIIDLIENLTVGGF